MLILLTAGVIIGLCLILTEISYQKYQDKRKKKGGGCCKK